MAAPKSSLKKREKIFYIRFSENGVRKRVSLHTDSLEAAKERQRQFDSAHARGEENVFPTKTPLPSAVAAYIAHVRVSHTRHGYTSSLSYLRNAFGAICDALKLKRRQNRTPGDDFDSRYRGHVIRCIYLEQITAVQVSDFIREHMQRYGIQPKTANRYREVIRRLFSWSMEEGGVRMPGDLNPTAKVKRYKERAPEIRFLTLQQVDEQLELLHDYPVIHAMVATYIYAGLRREEAIWLTVEDVDFTIGKFGVIRVQAKTAGGEFWQPKTKANRIVPISRTLRGILDGYVRPVVPSPWFFPSPQGKRWDPDNFSTALREINRADDLDWSCLMYRHTFGSQLAMKGESLYKIATLMGNSPEICRRHYATLTPEALVQSVEFDSEFAGNCPHAGPQVLSLTR